MILIKISLKFVPKGPLNNIPALVQMNNGLASTRRQAIIWTNYDYLTDIYSSIGLKELKEKNGI